MWAAFGVKPRPIRMKVNCPRRAAANRHAGNYDYLPKRMVAAPERTFSYYLYYYIRKHPKTQA